MSAQPHDDDARLSAPPLREARRGDVPRLVEMMAGFYAESGYVLRRDRAGDAFGALLDEPRLGRIWLVEQGEDVAGYVVVTVAFAMEYGGLVGVVDDFYVRPERRGEGLGTAALAAVRRASERLGLRALRVEVGPENVVAQAVYRSAGFEPLDHRLMGVALGEPAHET